MLYPLSKRLENLYLLSFCSHYIISYVIIQDAISIYVQSANVMEAGRVVLLTKSLILYSLY